MLWATLELPLGVLWDPFGRPGAYAVWVKFSKVTYNYRREGLQFNDKTCDYRRRGEIPLKDDSKSDAHMLRNSLFLQPKMVFLEF